MYPHCLAVMVPMLLSEPRAGVRPVERHGRGRRAVSDAADAAHGVSARVLRRRPVPVRARRARSSGPRRSASSADSIDEGVASDHQFWMRACTTVSVLLLPADLFWYRMHPSQEFQSEKGAAWSTRTPQAWVAARSTRPSAR